MTEKHFTCPRRIADGMDRDGGPHRMSGSNKDEMSKRRKNSDYATCTYCGSISSDDFMDAVRNGTVKVEPTDKAYKFYVDMPSVDPTDLRVITSANHHASGTTPYAQLSHAEKKAVKAEYKGNTPDFKQKFYRLIPKGATVHQKFYTHHLSREQGDEFIDLWTAQKIAWGYPGRPYVRLYIPCTPTEPRDGA